MATCSDSSLEHAASPWVAYTEHVYTTEVLFFKKKKKKAVGSNASEINSLCFEGQDVFLQASAWGGEHLSISWLLLSPWLQTRNLGKKQPYFHPHRAVMSPTANPAIAAVS